MSENGSNGHSVGTSAERTETARALLEPIVRRMVPDVRSALTITRSLFHAYYNLRYIGVDSALNEAFVALKAQGVIYRDALEALRRICGSMDVARQPSADPEQEGFLRSLNILQDSLPDHLVGPTGEIIWLADKQPHRPPLAPKAEALEPEPEIVPSSDLASPLAK